MQLKAAFVVITSVLLFLIFIQVIKILPTKSPSTNSSTSNDHVSHDTWSCFSQKMSFDHEYEKSVSVIYDFSSITSSQLQSDINSLLKNLNPQLVFEIILVQNKCEDGETQSTAVRLAHSQDKIKLVVIDAEEIVSTGRARIEGVKKTAAPFLLFVSAGVVPISDGFLESMLYSIRDSPDHVVCPTSEGNSHYHLTWSLNIQKLSFDEIGKTKHLPLLDDSIFLIRSDLYKAVGGYDSFFFKKDKAYMIAFSLSVWSCGGSIVQTGCAQARHMDHSPLNTEQRSVDYLQHAKYIQEVYGGSISLHFTFPGINFYKMSAYEQHAVTERKEMFRSLSCMTLEWYAHKFPKGLPLHPSDSKFYQPDYHPLLPVYQSRVRQVGRLFVLYAGHCVKVDGDQVLGLSWCPTPLPTNYKFIWQDNGQIVANSKCVTVRKDDSILTVADCMHGDDNSQLFVYQKTNKMIVSKHNDKCVTHFNGPNNRQVLRTLNCDADSPFNKFIINDLY